MKQPRLSLIFFYARANRDSFNALAGALETDAECRGLPVSFPTQEAELFEAIRAALETGRFAIVALSFATAQLACMQKLSQRLRETFAKRVILAAGGPHPSADPAACLRMGFDAVILGEGEATFVEFLKTSASGGDYSQIKGLAFAESSGQCRLTPPRPPIVLDHYPAFSARHRKIGPLEITRGCPHACGFCQTTLLFGARPRHRSIENICSAIALMRQNEMFDVRFVSPNAFSYGSPDGHALNLPALRELLAGMRQAIGAQGRLFFGTFPSEVRPEHVTEETAALVREFANNDNLVIGAQSGSPRLLNACRRGHTAEDAVRAVKFTLKTGLKANVDFIMGLPGETDEDAAQTIELIRSLARLGARIHAHAFIPLPQSGFANQTPSPVSSHWLGLLRQLTPVGGVYGQWQSQLKLAHKL